MNNMNVNMNNALIRVSKKFIYSYLQSANMNTLYIRIPLFLSEPYTVAPQKSLTTLIHRYFLP